MDKLKFKFVHNNFNVLELGRSMYFYEEALGLKEVRRITAEDGSFILVYLGDGETNFELELTWLRDRKEPYNLGDNEFHLAFMAKDYEAAHAKHKEMGCVVYENEKWAFISSPTLMGTGLRFCPRTNKPFLCGFSRFYADFYQKLYQNSRFSVPKGKARCNGGLL